MPVDPIPEDLAAQSGSKFLVPEQAQALEESRQEVKEEVVNLMVRVPTEHMDPTFRSRLRATIRGGVLRLGASSATSQSTTTSQALPANLELHALYGYDAFNRRIVRVIVGGDTLVSTYDGWREVAEHKVSAYQAQPVRQYVHGAQLDEILSYRRRVDVGGVYTWETYYLQHGGQDTASRLMSESGLIVEEYEYDPYGKTTIYNGSDVEVAFGNSKGLPFLWKSVHFDSETGLLYMRNRYYSAVTGRFLSNDPVGAWWDKGNAGNSVTYASNNPGTWRDVLGLQGERGVFGTLFGGLGSAIGGAGGFIVGFGVGAVRGLTGGSFVDGMNDSIRAGIMTGDFLGGGVIGNGVDGTLAPVAGSALSLVEGVSRLLTGDFAEGGFEVLYGLNSALSLPVSMPSGALLGMMNVPCGLGELRSQGQTMARIALVEGELPGGLCGGLHLPGLVWLGSPRLGPHEAGHGWQVVAFTGPGYVVLGSLIWQ